MRAGREHIVAALRAQRTFLAEHPRIWIKVAAPLLLEILLFWLVFPTPLRGFVLGATVVALAGAVWWRSMVGAGVYPSYAGGVAESVTDDVLRQLSSEGWTRFDNVIFADAEIDHVAVGPSGVLAVETKWTAVPSSSSAPARSPHVSWALGQAQRSARKVRLFLQSEGVDVQVVPVLLLWGPGAQHARRASAVIDGVAVLTGRQDADWLPALREPHLDAARVGAVVSALERYVERLAVSSPGRTTARR